MGKKTDNKSVRFNPVHLQYALTKTGIKKEQELIDKFLSDFYAVQNPSENLFKPDLLDKLIIDDEEVKLDADFFEKTTNNDTKNTDVNTKSISATICETITVNIKESDHLELKSKILQEIAIIKSEKIPKERDTVSGRKVWAIDQAKKIKELESKL